MKEMALEALHEIVYMFCSHPVATRHRMSFLKTLSAIYYPTDSHKEVEILKIDRGDFLPLIYHCLLCSEDYDT